MNSILLFSQTFWLCSRVRSAQRMITVQNPPLNFGGKACGYACVLLQVERGVIISWLFHARSVSERVLPNLGVGGGAPFSPFMLNVIQTKPLTHMSAQISQLAWQFSDPLLSPSSMKRKPERKCASHKITVHKRSTQSAQFDVASCSVKGSLVWLPEKLPSKWRECVCLCLWECRTKPFDIHVVTKCSLEKICTLTCTHPKGSRGQAANWCVSWCVSVYACVCVCVDGNIKRWSIQELWNSWDQERHPYRFTEKEPKPDGEIKNTQKGDVLFEIVSERSKIGSKFREVACYY